MRLRVTLTDDGGVQSEVVRGLGWVLALVRDWIRSGRTVTICTSGGTVKVKGGR